MTEYLIAPDQFLTKDNFSTKIEEFVQNESLNYFEAVIAFCEENNIEFEEAVKFMTVTLLEKVRQSARDMGYAQQEATIEGL